MRCHTSAFAARVVLFSVLWDLPFFFCCAQPMPMAPGRSIHGFPVLVSVAVPLICACCRVCSLVLVYSPLGGGVILSSTCCKASMYMAWYCLRYTIGMPRRRQAAVLLARTVPCTPIVLFAGMSATSHPPVNSRLLLLWFLAIKCVAL